jgi:hypothetical protein
MVRFVGGVRSMMALVALTVAVAPLDRCRGDIFDDDGQYRGQAEEPTNTTTPVPAIATPQIAA